MDLISPNLKLPYLAPAQAQKHVTHNEALRRLDAIVQLSVMTVTDTPPTDPQNGESVRIGENPQGVFADKAQHVAVYQDGAWAYLTPQVGWRCYVQDLAELHIFDGVLWQAIGGGGNSDTLATLGINTSADSFNRLSVKSPATLFDNEGAGHQLKINKSAATDTASVLFQSGYAGYAEMGLTGDDDFRIKTSGDGSTFRDVLIVDSETGAVQSPYGLNPKAMTTPTDNCGGPESFYGLPSSTSLLTGRSNLTLVANRMIFTAVYLDRECVLHGGLVAQYSAATTAGAVMRCGIYHLGTANGNGWDLGGLIHDFGTVPADVAGHKVFDTATPITLSQGWYAFAVGVDSGGAAVRYVQTRQPGLGYVQPYGSGSSADIRFGGPTSYMLDSNVGDEITNGLSQSWPDNPVGMVATTNSYAFNIFVPRWDVWT